MKVLGRYLSSRVFWPGPWLWAFQSNIWVHFFVWIVLSWTNAGALLCGETLYSRGWPVDWMLLEPHPDRPDQADAPICAVALSVGSQLLSSPGTCLGPWEPLNPRDTWEVTSYVQTPLPWMGLCSANDSLNVQLSFLKSVLWDKDETGFSWNHIFAWFLPCLSLPSHP